jgi:hypothetical protein
MHGTRPPSAPHFRATGGGRLAHRLAGMPALWCRFTLQSCLCPTPDFRSFHMGIALFNLSTLSSPLRTLASWLQPTLCLSASSDSGTPPFAHQPDKQLPQHGGRAAQAQPNRSSSGQAAERPLRGNWPFTVKPPAPPSESARLISAKCSCGPVRERLGERSTVRKDPTAGHASTRVVQRRARLHASAGHLVIAGGIADVCAELDRMIACEDALRAH